MNGSVVERLPKSPYKEYCLRIFEEIGLGNKSRKPPLLLPKKKLAHCIHGATTFCTSIISEKFNSNETYFSAFERYIRHCHHAIDANADVVRDLQPPPSLFNVGYRAEFHWSSRFYHPCLSASRSFVLILVGFSAGAKS